MVVYFLGKLMYIAMEDDEEKKFSEELVVEFIKDALKTKILNRRFNENFVVEENCDKGVLKKVYLMLMEFFKDKADVDVNEEDMSKYF